MNRTTWMRHSIPKTFHDENMIKKEEFQAAKSLKFFFFCRKAFPPPFGGIFWIF